jgi:nucleoid-associated protein
MKITEAILHQIKKEQYTTEAELVPRDSLLKNNETLSRLASDIQKKYTDQYVIHGSFKDDPEIERFPVMLRQYLNNEKSLVDFSLLAAALIKNEIAKKTTTTSGFTKFLRYESNGKDWLLVIMLKTSAQTGINLKTLELDESFVFDVQHLHEAARIDIEKLKANEMPYLTFVKPRSGKDDPSDYFRNALSCTDFSQPKHNTKQIITALDDYAKVEGWTPERKQEARKVLFEHCDKKTKDREPVVLQSLSAIINDQDPESFAVFVKNNDFEVSASFNPHPATYKSLKRISHKFEGINISFDVEDLTSGNIELKEDNDKTRLVINNVPQPVLDNIRKAKGL